MGSVAGRLVRFVRTSQWSSWRGVRGREPNQPRYYEHVPSTPARHAVRAARTGGHRRGREASRLRATPSTCSTRFSRRRRRSPPACSIRSTGSPIQKAARGPTASVVTPNGFKEAYKKFADAGWIGLPVPAEYGGQGLPQVLLGPTLEMWNARQHRIRQRPAAQSGRDRGDRTQRLRRTEASVPFRTLVSGKWTGTMCLTEPQAVPTCAGAHEEPFPTATAIGSPARRSSSPSASTTWPKTSSTSCSRGLPDAPEGTKDISLFIVPKFVVNDDGSLGEAQRRGLHGHRAQTRLNGNPTCTMSIGEASGTARSANWSANPIAASSTCS